MWQLIKGFFAPLWKGRPRLKISYEICRPSCNGEVSGLERCGKPHWENHCAGPQDSRANPCCLYQGIVLYLRNKLEVCYWILVEVKHLAIGQVNMPGTRDSILLSHNVRQAQPPIKPTTLRLVPLPHVPMTIQGVLFGWLEKEKVCKFCL